MRARGVTASCSSARLHCTSILSRSAEAVHAWQALQPEQLQPEMCPQARVGMVASSAPVAIVAEQTGFPASWYLGRKLLERQNDAGGLVSHMLRNSRYH